MDLEALSVALARCFSFYISIFHKVKELKILILFLFKDCNLMFFVYIGRF